MTQTLKLKRSAVAGRAPTTSDLELGELAINTTDGKLYIKKSVSGTESIVALSSAQAGELQTQQFSGNGSTTAFTLSATPTDENALLVFIGGAYQNKDSYAISGTTLTFDTAPDNGTDILVHHFRGGLIGTAPAIDTMTGDGSDTTLTLSVSPQSENQTFVTIDGVVQHKDTYSISGTTLTFASAPSNSAKVECVTFRNTVVTTFEDGDGDTKIQVEESSDEDTIRFDTAGSQRLSILSTGVTKIEGTNSLQFNTNGSIKYSSSPSSIIFSNASSEDIHIKTVANASAGEIQFSVNNSETARIVDGAVLIGTNSSLHSSADLQIQGASSNFARIMLKDQDGTTQHAFIDKSGADLTLISQNGTSHGTVSLKTFDGTDTLARLTVASDGNIGIGTTSPATKLEVAGNITLPSDGQIKFRGTNHYPRIFASSNNLLVNVDNGSGTNFTALTIDNGGTTTLKGGTADTSDHTLIVRNSSSTALFSIRNDGRIDVGGSQLLDSSRNFSNIGTITQTTNGTILDSSANLTNINNVYASGYRIGSTTVIDSSRNLTNIGTISSGTITSSGNIDVNSDSGQLQFGADNDMQIFHNGANGEINNATGNFIIDSAGDITLDADGQDILFKDGGTQFGSIRKNGNNLQLMASIQDGDITFHGNDGGSAITALTLDMSAGGAAIFNTDVRIPDNAKFMAGASQDLQIYHNGTNTLIENATGDLNIRNDANDGDITLQTDDGSGGVSTYLRVDGTNERINLHKNLRADDNVRLQVGGDGDMSIYHNGTNTLIENATGDLIIQNSLDDKDVIFKSDDGSGGVTPYLTIDGSHSRMTIAKNTLLFDNVELRIGDNSGAGDLKIYHNGTHSILENSTGDLILINNADDKDILIQTDDGSGSVTNYMKFDGGANVIDAVKPLRVRVDNTVLAVGASNDWNVSHNGTDTFQANNTGHFYITNTADDKDIVLRCDDGSGGVTAYLTLDGSAAHTTFQKDISLADNINLKFGATSGDMLLFHDGSHSFIHHNGTGALKLKEGSADAIVIDDGVVSLNHSGSTKLATASGGVAVTGSITGTGKVGINTTDPDAQGYSFAEDLVILGGNSADDGVGITLRGNGKRYGVLAFGDNADPNSGEVFYDHTNNEMSFRTNDQIALTINSSQNASFGGTVSVTNQLSINGTTDTIAYLNVTDDGPIYVSYNRSGDRHAYVGFGGSNDVFNIMNEESGGSITLGTAGSNRLTVQSDGNITTSHNLTVGGSLTVQGSTTTVSSTNTTLTDTLLELNSGASSNANDSGIIIERGSTGDNALFIWDESGDHFALGTTTATADATGNITYSTANLNLGAVLANGNFQQGGTTVIDTSRNLTNINNATIGGSITVGDSHTIGDDGNDNLAIASSSGENILVNSANHVLIQTGGTTKLETQSSGVKVTGTLEATGELLLARSTPSIHFFDSDDNSDGYIQANGGTLSFFADDNNEVSNSIINFSIDGSEKMRLDNAGNVGIGTTSPAKKLQVSTSSDVDGITIENTSTANSTSKRPRLFFKGTDTVGTSKEAAIIEMTPENSDNVDSALSFYTRASDSTTEKVRITGSGNIQMGGTTVIDSSRNLTNIGTYSGAGDITVSKSDPTLILNDTSGSDNQARLWLRESANFGAQLQYNSNNDEFFHINTLDGGTSTTGLIVDRYSNVTVPNGTFTVGQTSAGKNVQLFVGLDAVTTDDTGLTFTAAGTYSDGRYEHRFRKNDLGGGIPLFVDRTEGTANSHSAIARFGRYTNNPEEFEVYGSAKIAGGFDVRGIHTIQTDGGNEQLVIKRESNTNEQLILGFHSSDYGTIQAVEQGVAYRRLKLQPSGGSVEIGQAADGLVFQASHSESKIRLYDGGTEKIGTASGTLVLTGNTINFKKVSGTPDLALNGTTFLNSSRELVNIAGYTQTSGNASIEHASSPTFELKDTTNNVTFKAYAQDSNAFVGTTSSHNLNIGTNNTTAININNSQAVELYHGNSKKIETTSTGATVTGNLRATSGLGYTIADTAGNSDQYIKFGTFTTSQAGHSLAINVYSNVGFNASDAQNQNTIIRFKTSNNSSNQSGFYGDAQAFRFGVSTGAPAIVIVKQNSTTEYEFYGKFGNYTGNASFYTVEHANGTWTHDGTNTGGTAPSGTTITVTPSALGGSGGSSDSITDADGDTKIQVEESSDEDKIRFDTAGTERARIDATGVTSTGPFRAPTNIAMVVNSIDFIEYSGGFRIGSVADDDESLTLVGFGGSPKIELDDGVNVRILEGSTECARFSSTRSLFGTTTATGKFGINTGTSGGVNASASTQANGSVIFGNTDGSSVVPAIMMKGDGGRTQFRAATANGANFDIEFNIRENDGSDYASTGGAGFLFSRYGTDLLQITRHGNVDIGFSSGVGTGDGNPALRATQASTSFNGNLLQLQAKRPSSSAYSLIQAYANFASDPKFKVRGDGEVSADGSFSGGGADYAEYFEWQDGNPNNEDRIGYSVSLVNGKIKIAESGETIIGVTSANPSVTGDSQELEWQGKFLKDEFGRYIEEDYTATEWIKETSDESDTPKREKIMYHTDKIPSDVTVPENAVVITVDENGNNLRRRKLNPNYDESLTYVPRSERKEWECVGIMGKVRLRKEQQKSTSWIKLRDMSDTVEEWLIK